MNKYYTTLEISESGYTATIFNAQNNQPVYKTKPYSSQAQASYDANIYLTTNKAPESVPPAPQTITNTTVYRPTPNTATPRRCCGR